MTYKILCIDGGGIRGAFALQILHMLQEDIGKDLLTKLDCFAGTSTGSLIVAAISQGFSPKELLRFYNILGSRVFPKPKNKEKGMAKYDNTTLIKALKIIFPKNPKLSEIEKHVIIPACKLYDERKEQWSMEIYDNFDRINASHISLIDAALRSSAAPIYFPSYQKCIDGGVYAHNPSLLALSRAIDEKGGNQNIKDIRLLSIGNGKNPGGINEELNWDEHKWMAPYPPLAKHPLYSLLTEMNADTPDYPLGQILKKQYLRINAFLPHPVEMDDTKSVKLLIKTAKSIREKTPEIWDSYLDWVQDNI